MKKHLNLEIGAKARLAFLKDYAEKHNEKHGNGKPGQPIDWREARYSNFKSPTGLDQGFNGSNERNRVPVWYAENDPVLSRVMFADECPHASKDVKESQGWYMDVAGFETMRGIVARLPHGKAIAGYYQSANGEYVWFPTVYSTDREALRERFERREGERNAAREADHLAHREAEEARAHDYREREADKLTEKIEDALQRVRELIVLRHVACMAYARDELREAIAEIRNWQKTLRTEYADVL